MRTLRDSPGDGRPPAHELVLLVIDEDGDVATHVLPREGEVVLGRDPQCTIVLDASRVSRAHVRIRLGSIPTVEDLGSTNGTRMHGRALEAWTPVPLAPGSALEIGSLLLLVQRRSGDDRRAATESDPAVDEALSSVDAVVLDPVMQDLYRVVERIARGQISVLIQGETGSGKELVAEAVHRGSPRRGGPFLRLNSAAFTETLLESELFGHEKGSFTGADRAKIGLLESAKGGTVFLDEVGELPLVIQAKLLRVIEHRQVMPVGAVATRPIDVRFVAATNRDLDAEVAAGRFRQDLLYRLNGVILRVPPLRDRPMEIEPLARRFAAAASAALGLPAPRPLAPDAVAWLREHDWPGNVRELKNVMERAVLLAGDGPIRPEHLHTTGAAGPDAAAPAPGAAPGDDDAAELARIRDALDRCHGNQTRAARLLGIARSTLVRKLDAHGLPRPRK